MNRFHLAIILLFVVRIGIGQEIPNEYTALKLNPVLNGSLTSVDPESATIPESLVVEIAGSGTHFSMGTGTSVWFSHGSNTVWSSNTVEMNNTLLQAQLLFTNNHEPGYYDVNTLNESDGHLVLSNAFYLNENPNPPILLEASPESGQAGEVAILTITGQYTHFDQGYNYAYLYKAGGSSLSATYVTVLDSETMEAEFHVPTNTIAGFYNMQIYNSLDGNMGLMNAFEVTVDPDPPYLTDIEPNNGSIPENLTVTISGVNTHFNQGTGTFVNLKHATYYTTLYPQSVSPISDTEINATFLFDNLDQTGYYDVKTYSALDGGLVLYDAFYLNPNPNPPTLVSINPDQAEPGQTLDVEISGQNTSFSQGTGTIAWLKKGNTSIYPNTANADDDETLDANFYISPNAPTGWYTLNTLNNTDGHLILSNVFNVNYLSPQLVMVEPDHGYTGDIAVMELTGENTHFQDASTSMQAWMSKGNIENPASSITTTSNTTVELEFDLNEEFEAGIWTIGIQNDIDGEVLLQDGFEVIDTISSISNIKNLYTLQIAPNPSAGVFTISLQSIVKKEVHLVILDQTGARIEEYRMEAPPVVDYVMDLTDHPAGIYFIQVNFNGTSSSYKIILSK